MMDTKQKIFLLSSCSATIDLAPAVFVHVCAKQHSWMPAFENPGVSVGVCVAT